MSEVKVNKISPRTNCGTVTLGDSGDTFTIPSGATITNNGTAAGFGATGAASWDTTVKTSGFTAVSGVGYFVNTTSGAITVTLPASPAAGAVVAVKDYANTFDTNNVTLGRNGSNIGGVAADATLSTEGLAVTLVFVDATQGWLVTDDGLQSNADTNPFIEATGGTVTTSGNDKIHTFTGPGTFIVSTTATCAANNVISYIVVAGGGAGGSHGGGGGGAGGFREDKSPVTPYTASPLDGAGPITVTATSFPITVGGGGTAANNAAGGVGTNSTFNTITSTGGGGGGGSYPSVQPATAGGSGGGSGGPTGTGAAGNTPPVSPSQGFPGGNSAATFEGGGGGGATAVGGSGTAPNSGAGPGGAGATSSINGTPTERAGGGGGSTDNSPQGTASGGGGAGANGPSGNPGTANTGGGGGGNHSGPPATGGNGGSGIVVIRYKFQ